MGPEEQVRKSGQRNQVCWQDLRKVQDACSLCLGSRGCGGQTGVRDVGESKLLGVSFDARERLWAPLPPGSHLSCALASPAFAHSTCVVRVCGTSQLGRSLFPNEDAPPGWLLPLGVCTGWKEKAGLMEAWAGAGAMLGTGWASVSRVVFED